MDKPKVAETTPIPKTGPVTLTDPIIVVPLMTEKDDRMIFFR